MSEEKSRFMTIVAWVLILISSLAIIGTTFNFFDETPIIAPDFNRTPLVSFVTTHAKTINVALLGLAAVTLTGAIGLLLNKHWARVVLISVLPIGVVYNIVEIFTISETLRDISVRSAENASSSLSNGEDLHDKMELAVKLGFWLLIVLNIGMSLFYIWIVKRLMRRVPSR